MHNDHNILKTVEEGLSSFTYPEKVAALYEPIIYTLAPGGKRIRPLLCLRACEACGNKYSTALNQAMAIEMFHNFTLIHDDVMDNSDIRRGRPTVCAKWDDTQAILSGDALLTLATQLVVKNLTGEKAIRALTLFNKTALEVYEGQQLDMDFEKRDDVTTDEYLEMIRLKTSVLLGCACAMGVLTSENGSEDTFEKLYKYGEQLGIAFQLRDDWLDTFGDPETFGKPIGGDIRNRKKTWLFITALTERPHEMAEALSGEEDLLLDKVKAVYETLNLSERCDSLIRRYCDEAIRQIETSDIKDDSKEWFRELALQLCSRTK